MIIQWVWGIERISMKSKLQQPGSHAHRHTFTEDLDLRHKVHKNNSESLLNIQLVEFAFLHPLWKILIQMFNRSQLRNPFYLFYNHRSLREMDFQLTISSCFLSGVIDSEQLRELKIIFSVIQQNPLRFEWAVFIEQNLDGTFSNLWIVVTREERDSMQTWHKIQRKRFEASLKEKIIQSTMLNKIFNSSILKFGEL